MGGLSAGSVPVDLIFYVVTDLLTTIQRDLGQHSRSLQENRIDHFLQEAIQLATLTLCTPISIINPALQTNEVVPFPPVYALVAKQCALALLEREPRAGSGVAISPISESIANRRRVYPPSLKKVMSC